MKTGWLRWVVFLAVLACAGCHSRPHPLTSSPQYTIQGRVVFEGPVPAPRRLTIPPGIAGPEAREVLVQPYAVDPAGGLGEVLVYIADPPAGRPPLPTRPVPLVISNTFCHPSLVAVATNQPVLFQVTGQTMLNLSAASKAAPSQSWNRAITGNTTFEKRFPQPDLQVRITDNVALWLHARIAVFDHPWFAVTDPSGRFTLPALPPGRYTLEIGHRRSGHQTLSLEVGDPTKPILIHMAAPAAPVR
ncbi:MAG: carboxypeptidase regulatory-like domain-containing protein [Verrucomicrobia bacterium]|nr:carboxypeptidase regulatory-like domain-containing protein [Verrucomicrobiota bacterium]